jgi:hypothetical protein
MLRRKKRKKQHSKPIEPEHVKKQMEKISMHKHIGKQRPRTPGKAKKGRRQLKK